MSDARSVPARGSSSLPSEPNASYGLGLSSGHNGPLSHHTARAERARGGSHNRLRFGKRTKPDGSGGVRSRVTEFSRKSRKRLLDMLNAVDKDRTPKPLFLTLTYSDKCAWYDPENWQKNLKAFRKRLVRRWGKFPVVWKMEFKERKSGTNVGDLVPHFHLLAFADLPLDELRQWLSVAWFEVVGSGDPEHLAAGTSAEQVKSWNGVHAYAAKYMGKLEKLLRHEEGCGRIWGVWDKPSLCITHETTTMTVEDGVRARRALARWAGRSLKSRKDLHDFSIYAPASILDALAASWGYAEHTEKGGGYREWKKTLGQKEALASGSPGDRCRALGEDP